VQPGALDVGIRQQNFQSYISLAQKEHNFNVLIMQ